jgi:hypothetical protein
MVGEFTGQADLFSDLFSKFQVQGINIFARTLDLQATLVALEFFNGDFFSAITIGT